MTILGVDPGIARAGWGVLKKDKQIMTLAYGCIETSKENTTPERLLLLYKQLKAIFKEYKPDVLAIEDLFFNTNAKTAISVGQARGVTLLIAAEYSIPVAVYTPPQVKTAVTGYGRADKKQVGEMVKLQLKLNSIPKPDDIADALAIALTHASAIRLPA